jgi:hypothetical protein
MDDSLERDQLNLWEKLNRLYGDDAGREAGPQEDCAADLAESVPESPVEETAPHIEFPPDEGLGSMALEEVELAPGYRESIESGNEVNEVCVDCRFGCEQPARGFMIDRCKLANASRPEKRGATPNQVAASAGSMGIEKINETCRRCRRSCKQRTTKLNRMLCLGFVPIDDGRSEHD